MTNTLKINLDELSSDIILLESTKKKFTEIILEDGLEQSKKNIVLITSGSESIKEPLTRTVVTLILGAPSVYAGEKLTFDDVYTGEPSSQGITKYFDDRIRKYKETLDTENYVIFKVKVADAIQSLSHLTSKINFVFGNTLSLLDFLDAMKENKEVEELIYFQIPQNMQFDEIERTIKSAVDRMVEVLCKKKGTNIERFLNCGSMINIKQFGQCVVCVGLKPDIAGLVLSEPVNSNFLRGINNVTEYYINSLGARKALVTNFYQVRNSGYLARKISLVCADLEQDPELEDCHTGHYINAEISDKATLKRLDGRICWDEYGNEHLICAEEDKDLIGQTVFLRSPITCASEKICRKCYGIQWRDILGLNAGLVATLLLTAIFTQMLLSTKHLLQTKSSTINWPDDFSDSFTVDKATVTANSNVNKIMISVADVEEDENLMMFTRTISFKLEGSRDWTKVSLPVKLFLNEAQKNTVRSSTVESIDYKPGDTEEGFDFFMSLENNEISASLKLILDLIDKNNGFTDENIDDVYNTFISLLNESGITIQSNHIEMILRSLLRKKDDINALPDFSQDDFPEFDVLSVTKSVLNGPLAISLVFEQIRKQLGSPETFDKNASSVLDELYSR